MGHIAGTVQTAGKSGRLKEQPAGFLHHLSVGVEEMSLAISKPIYWFSHEVSTTCKRSENNIYHLLENKAAVDLMI